MIMAFFGVPVFFDKPLLLIMQYTPDHIMTISAVSIIFIISSKIIKKSFYFSKPIDLLLFFFLSTMTYTSDELSLFICAIPILIMSTLNIKNHEAALIFFITAFSAIISHIVIADNIMFYTINLPASFADFSHFIKNINELFYYLSLLLGADFWGLPLKFLSLFFASRLVLFYFIVYYLYIATKKAVIGTFCNKKITYDFSNNFLIGLCVLAIIINLASAVFSNAFYIYGSYISSNIRYVFPALVFSAAIVAGFYKNKIVFIISVLIVFITACADLSSLKNSEHRDISAEVTDIVKIVKKKGYLGGFAPYWYGNIITLASRAKILAEPIAPAGAGGAKTIYWPAQKVYAVWNSDSLLSKLINKNHFFVITDTNTPGDIKISQAEKYFGTPKKIEDVPGYSAKILFYSK